MGLATTLSLLLFDSVALFIVGSSANPDIATRKKCAPWHNNKPK